MKPTIELRDINELTPHPRNSRTHSPEQLTKLAKSIEQFGFVKPIIADEDDVILAGHGIWEAAKHRGMTEVPVLSKTDLTDEQKRAYMIADNRLSELSSWDWDRLADELQVISGARDLAELGFDRWDPQAGMSVKHTKTGELSEDDLETTNTCPSCGFEY